MFASAYQQGECVEVFTPSGSQPLARWKVSSRSVKRVRNSPLSLSVDKFFSPTRIKAPSATFFWLMSRSTTSL